eukprot:CAMPEP_0119050366 /NCGR_PEP_ID=MMETSP1177-20130426/69538_1 /TAXON_ID=2985 /ORGANISM="Ochromonas sp, Strain CCMP1899" /LENGTH=39 /DNA_ID= /DNA_START= /DNA_END= /DNA_ORIENTATION=
MTTFLSQCLIFVKSADSDSDIGLSAEVTNRTRSALGIIF